MTVVAETTQFPGSSNLAEASYDPDNQELVITFVSGRAWRYRNVPVATYTGLQRAGSAGQYFYRQIRDRYVSEEE